jgi:hypothetical protein
MSQPELSPQLARNIDRFLDSNRQRVLREWVKRFADAYGSQATRTAAFALLSDEDPKMVEVALSILFVVGTSSDVAAVEPLVSHTDIGVQKAARICLSEIRHRKPEA